MRIAFFVPRLRVFTVRVVISNKEGASDPEGETIYRDLVSKAGFKGVKSIRSGKSLRVSVEAPDTASARRLVTRMCDELRIYNPAAHSITVEV
jgi:phosphoribosylformylglycinamidine synthase